ncbi:hypothetical protein ACLOJK_011958 [Asimina triloba]
MFGRNYRWGAIKRLLICGGPPPPPHDHQVPHANQVVNESVHGAQFALESLKCESCVEENVSVCKCLENTGKLDTNLKHGTDTGGHDRQVKADSSFAHSVINMVGMLIGLGQLSTPYALETGGWAAALLLVGLGVACAYSSHLMGKCMKENPKSKDYKDIGQHAFGAKGRIISSIAIYLEVFLALVSYTISLSDNLGMVFFGTHVSVPWLPLSTRQLLTVMAVFVALPSLRLRDLSSISFLSFGGILMSILIFATVAWTALFRGIQANHQIPFIRLHKIPAISGLCIFGYAGHIVFPNIYTAMRDPSKFTKVSITSFTLVTALYTALAFMGAKLFGPQVNSQFTLSMPCHLLVTKIALWATVLTPMTKYALEFAPIAMQLQQKLPPTLTSNTKFIIRGCFGSLALLLILVLALSLPYFQHVLALTGSLVSIAISVILPCAFHMKICWQQLSKPTVFLDVVLVALGCLLGLSGTISSSKSLIKSLARGHSA